MYGGGRRLVWMSRMSDFFDVLVLLISLSIFRKYLYSSRTTLVSAAHFMFCSRSVCCSIAPVFLH